MTGKEVKLFCVFDGGELKYHIGLDRRCVKCGLVYGSQSENMGISDLKRAVIPRVKKLEAGMKGISEMKKLVKLLLLPTKPEEEETGEITEEDIRRIHEAIKNLETKSPAFSTGLGHKVKRGKT